MGNALLLCGFLLLSSGLPPCGAASDEPSPVRQAAPPRNADAHLIPTASGGEPHPDDDPTRHFLAGELGRISSPQGSVSRIPTASGGDISSPQGSVIRVPQNSGVLSGIDVLEAEAFRPLQDRRIGLITGRNSVDRLGRPIAQVLAQAQGVRLKALFFAERGSQGPAQAPADSTDAYRLPDGTSAPVFSLFGSTKGLTAQRLSGLDALVLDLQDAGSRFADAPATLASAMEAAAAQDMDLFVLDRPNPLNGETVAGPVVDEGMDPRLAALPAAVRHAMTLGELARLQNMSGRVGARLQVIPLRGWSRSMWQDQTGLRWLAPFPDIADLEAAALYPGIGCLEASNISVGLGTPWPFRWIGAPWLNDRSLLKRLRAAGLKGYAFKSAACVPSKNAFKGRKCRGVRIRLLDRTAADPLALFAHIACALRDLHPMEFGLRSEELARRTGTARFERLYASGARPQELIAMFRKDAARFKAWRAPFLLY